MELPEQLPDLTPRSLQPVPWGSPVPQGRILAARAELISESVSGRTGAGGRISIKSQPVRGLGKRDPQDAQTLPCPLSSRRSYCSRASLKPQLRPARPAYPRFFPTAGPRAIPPSVRKPRARKERTTLCPRTGSRTSVPSPPPATMSSEELACKMQRRLRLEVRAETDQGGPQPAPCAAPAGHPEPEPPARSPTASADSELNLKLSRRLDIHQGTARPGRSKVFNPYTEFPEFSRRLLKDLERMFKT